MNSEQDSLNDANGVGGSTDEQSQRAPSWILELRSRLEGDVKRLEGADDRVVFLVPLFVHADGLWTILGEDVVTDEGSLARVSFPAGRVPVDEPAWPVAAALIEEVLGLDPTQGLEIGEMAEQRSLGGVRVLPLVVAIPRPETVGRTLSAGTQGGLALFPFPVMSLLEPYKVTTRTVDLPEGPEEVEVINIDDHQLWGPSLEVLERLVAILAT